MDIIYNKLILQLRIEAQLDRFEFASILEITPKNLYQIELFHINVSAPTLRKLAKVLGVTTDLLTAIAFQEEKYIPPVDEPIEYTINRPTRLYKVLDLTKLSNIIKNK